MTAMDGNTPRHTRLKWMSGDGVGWMALIDPVTEKDHRAQLSPIERSSKMKAEVQDREVQEGLSSC
jgi:hypothetical protein